MSDFTKGVIIFMLFMIFASIVADQVGQAVVYADKRDNDQMTGCMGNGYTYGECFNVIHAAITYKFNK